MGTRSHNRNNAFASLPYILSPDIRLLLPVLALCTSNCITTASLIAQTHKVWLTPSNPPKGHLLALVWTLLGKQIALHHYIKKAISPHVLPTNKG